MSKHAAFVPYSLHRPVPTRFHFSDPLTFLSHILAKKFYEQSIPLPTSFLLDLLHSWPAKSLPSPVYRAQFPDLMKSCRNLILTKPPPKTSDSPPAAALASKGNTKDSNSQNFVLSCGKTNAYKRRNVYKSVIRHMFSYVQCNKPTTTKMLTAQGFPQEEIDTAFSYISSLNTLDKQKGKTKRPQYMIRKMLDGKNIYVYILRETLTSMLTTFQSDTSGKVMRKNTFIYKEVCEEYLAKCSELLQSQENEAEK